MDQSTEHSHPASSGRVIPPTRSIFSEIRCKSKFIWTGIAAAVIFTLLWIMTLPPANFSTETPIDIPDGASLSAVSGLLKNNRVIKSELVFELFVMIYGGDGSVKAGRYFFKNPARVSQIARRVTSGEFGVVPIRVTIPEGLTVRETAATIADKLPGFDAEAFVAIGEPYEGYLFPDTYLFLPGTSPDAIVQTMRSTFEERMAKIDQEVGIFGKSREEVVIMASLLEKEARTDEDRRKIADILWRRIEIGMPLQVDAAFIAVNGKTTYDLTLEDLEIDSLFNTYRNRGLPPVPIVNPGLAALRAAVTPEQNQYLFYLSDRSGTIYYARDFETHKALKRRYVY